MTASGDDQRLDPVLGECLRDPALGRRRLPAVLGHLDADDRRTRLAAAWTCCLVATEYDDLVPAIVRRLVDRLDEPTLELTHTFDYVAASHPEAVEDVLADLEMASTDDEEGARRPRPESGPFTREYFYESSPSRGDVGRIRFPGGNEDDPRLAYSTEAETDPSPSPADGGPDAGNDAAGADAEDAGDEEASDASADSTEASDESSATDRSGELVQQRTAISAIASRSRFDHLHILASQRRTRYSEDYDALVGQGAEEEAIVLRLLKRPDRQSDRAPFEAEIGAALARWAEVDDHPHVVSLLDWGREPRPWAATSFAGESLAAIEDRSVTEALDNAIALADAVAHCHRTDVVHAGLDPESVAYPGDVLDSNDQEPPLLNNVSLLPAFRYYRNPAELLDPRFAAPEYYERRFGRVDASTDVYGLGALVYYLFTGEPPVRGTFESVKAAVTGEETPRPSDVEPTVPAAVDDVVRKAMATAKLRRYDTVDHLHQDLVSLREDGLA